MSYNQVRVASAIASLAFSYESLIEESVSSRRFYQKSEVELSNSLRNTLFFEVSKRGTSENRKPFGKAGEFPHNSQKSPEALGSWFFGKRRKNAAVPALVSSAKLFSLLRVPTLKYKAKLEALLQNLGNKLSRPYYCLQLTDLQIVPIPILGNYSFSRLGLAFFFFGILMGIGKKFPESLFLSGREISSQILFPN